MKTLIFSIAAMVAVFSGYGQNNMTVQTASATEISNQPSNLNLQLEPPPTSIQISSAELPLLIYPNPTKESLTLVSTSTMRLINIYSLDGTLVKTFQIGDNNSFIDISALPSGIYLVQIQTDNEIILQKISKI